MMSHLEHSETPVTVGKNAPSMDSVLNTKAKFLPVENSKGQQVEDVYEFDIGYHLGYTSMQDDPELTQCLMDMETLKEAYLNLPYEDL